MIRGVDAGRIVDRVGVDAPALERVGDAAALGDAEIGALADDLGADLVAVDAQRVVGAVADLGVALARGLDVGADAAEPQQIDRGRQHWRISSAGVRWSASMPKARFISGLSGIDLALRSKTPPPCEISARS